MNFWRLIFSLLIGLIVLTHIGHADEGTVGTISKEEIEPFFKAKRLALVIGINDFDDSNWQSLRFAGKDADNMASALVNPDLGFFDEVIKRVDPSATNRANVMEALAQLNIANTNSEDTVYIYISTHGTLARDSNGQLQQYLVAKDTQFDDVVKTGINVNDLITFFNRMASHRKVLVLASCHSGMGKSKLPDDIKVELGRLKSQFFIKPLEAASEASVIIGVCAWGETAQEDPNLENDIYTHFFIEGMKKYDRNDDGAVSISEAHDYAQRQTYYFTKGEQRPFARSDILGADPIIMSGNVNRSGKPVVFSYGHELEGMMLAIDGTQKGALPDGFASGSGWSKIKAYEQDTGVERHNSLIYIRDGERINLDKVISSRSAPKLGLVSNYSLTGSDNFAEDVFPDMMLMGLSYKLNAFPFTNSSLRLESSYGHSEWEADFDNHQSADIKADALLANAALLYSYNNDQAEYFVGPMVGGIFLSKTTDNSYDEESTNATSFSPGAMAGVLLPLNPSLHLELAGRANYNLFNVDGKNEGVFTNQASMTIFYAPGYLLSFK
jgi:Caspase domain